MKNKTLQRYIFKINSTRIIESGFDLKISLDEARLNNELIGLSESQLMRFIDELNGVSDCSEKILTIKNNLDIVKKSSMAFYDKRTKIKKLYDELDSYIFKKDIINVVMDKPSDYKKLCRKKLFKVNGITFHRLVGTTNGVKHDTITFINVDLWNDIMNKIDNGRDLNKKFVTAKLEAYKSLVCSSSFPVTAPYGVIVVKDCETEFVSDFIKLDDSDNDEPVETFCHMQPMKLVENDGYGMAMPSLMEKWGYDIGVNYTLPGCVIRNAFCKGAVFPVDFQKFCKDNNVEYVVDAWGEPRDIKNVELVLTTSMLKLWDSYKSMESYLDNCQRNGYCFCITKNAEDKLENQRTTNYQFLQSYKFSDEDIDELLLDTINEIKDIQLRDYRKTILYLKGTDISGQNIINTLKDGGISSALMVNPDVMRDPYIHAQINKMIHKRIDDAKIGVLNISGNYSLVCGDPYSLCQSMCGMEVTGLLKSGEVYSKYWIDKGVDKIAVFRAPMTSHNNIRVVNVVHNDDMDEFYKYITTPTLFNSWDMCANALNGMDKDGDCTINTNNPILVNKVIPLPAIECIQRTAEKTIATEKDVIESNILSFGNDVGSVTNKVTSMFDIRDNFGEDTDEYKIMDYRIRCGQLYQQNSIDKTKGIQANDMPVYWHNLRGLKNVPDDKKEMYSKLVSNKKPYFMTYIYPNLKTDYLNYIKNCNAKSQMLFGYTIDELLSLKNKTLEQQGFVNQYNEFLPVTKGQCVVNKICYKIEELFNYKDTKFVNKDFNYSIYKSDLKYSKNLYDSIYEIYVQYIHQVSEYMKKSNVQRIKDEDRINSRFIMLEAFKRKCEYICPNDELLCNILVDICYSGNSSTKQFVWDMCGNRIIVNMLEKNDYYIDVPVKDPNGNILFQGMRFSMKKIDVQGEYYDYIERCGIFQ